jgi:hypothetical protein
MVNIPSDDEILLYHYRKGVVRELVNCPICGYGMLDLHVCKVQKPLDKHPQEVHS